MAGSVSVGTAKGSLTLDASKFIKNIESAYKSLKSFYDLVEDTQKAIDKMPDSIDLKVNTNTQGGSKSTTSPLGDIDTSGLKGIGGEADKSKKKVELLQDALSVGLTGSLQAMATVAEVTWKAFEKYTEFVVDFAKDSLEVGTAFDAQMSKVSAIAKATGDDFDELRNKAIDLGGTTKFHASEVAEAMEYMGMAGWNTTQILDGVEGVLSLAAASGEDLATTSDIVTDALTAFGLRAEDAGHFADVLATAATSSNTNVALMGETFKYVAPLAGTLHYSIEDMAQAIGLMANAGIKGSQAGTALRNILSNLEKPSESVSAAMSQLGISLVDAETGETKDFIDVMKDLRSAFSGLSADGSFELFRDMVEDLNQQLEAGEITAEEYEDKYNSIQASVLKSTETLQGQYAAMIAGKYGLSGLLAIVSASDEDFNSLARSIGYANIPLTTITDSVKKSGVAWEQYAGDAESSNKLVDDVIDQMINDLQTLGLSGEEARENLEANFGLSTEDAQEALNSLATEFFNAGGASKEMEQIMMNNLQGSLTVFDSTLETFKIRISDVLKTPVRDIVNWGQNAIYRLTQSLQNEGIPGLIRTVGEIIPEAAKMLVPYIAEVIPPLVEGFWSIINGLVDILEDDETLDLIIDAAVNLFMGLTTGIIQVGTRLVKIIPDVVDALCDALDNNDEEFLQAAIDLFILLVEATAKALPRIIQSAIKIVKDIAHAFAENQDEILEAGIDLLLAVIEGLTDPETIKNLLVACGEIIGAIVTGLHGDSDAGDYWLDLADKIFSGLGAGLLGIFQGALGAIDALLGTNFEAWGKDVATFFGDLKQKSFEFGKSLANSMNKTEIELNDLAQAYDKNYQDMLDYYSSMVQQGMNAQEAMARAYQEYFQSAEAQYVFRERFAGNVGKLEYMDQRLFSEGITNQQLVDLLSKAQATTGNTYNFFTKEPIDERKAADNIKKINMDILLGY